MQLVKKIKGRIFITVGQIYLFKMINKSFFESKKIIIFLKNNLKLKIKS